MKEVHKINNELQKQLNELKDTNAELSRAAEMQKQEEKRLIDRIKSLEASNAELCSTGDALKRSIHSNNCTIESLQENLSEKSSTIETLNDRIKELEKLPSKELSVEETSAKDKEIYDLQVDVAYLEKSNQDLELQVTRSNDQITKMQDVWTQDKNRLIKTESMYSDAQLQLKNLTQNLGETQAQLKEVKALNDMKKEAKTSDLPPKTSTREGKERDNLESSSEQGGNHQAPVVPTKQGQELCIYELIEPGKCRRKEKCKFNHSILPHMREETWINTKLAQLSKTKGRCIREMVQKGSCPKKNECNHPHLKDKPGSAKKVCFRELEKQGSCPRGENCRFSHIISDTERESTELQRQANLHKNSSQWICVNEYRHEHSCRKGEKCGFRHSISAEERQSASLQEKMNQKWERITNKFNGVKSTDETSKEELPKTFLEEFRTFMKEMRTLANRPGNCP